MTRPVTMTLTFTTTDGYLYEITTNDLTHHEENTILAAVQRALEEIRFNQRLDTDYKGTRL